MGVNLGVAVGCVCVHTGMHVQVLSTCLATPRGVDTPASVLFFSELFFYQGVGIITHVWLSKKAF